MYRERKAIYSSLWAIACLLGAATMLIWAYGMHLTGLPYAVAILCLTSGALLGQAGRLAKAACYHWARFKGPVKFNLGQAEEKVSWVIALWTVLIILAYTAIIHIAKQ